MSLRIGFRERRHLVNGFYLDHEIMSHHRVTLWFALALGLLPADNKRPQARLESLWADLEQEHGAKATPAGFHLRRPRTSGYSRMEAGDDPVLLAADSRP